MIEMTRKAPQEFKELAWDVFFRSRHRGRFLEFHFPFFHSETAYYITLTVRGLIVAGLVVLPVARPEMNRIAGLVGLVCVHPAHRGMGYARALLQAAIKLGHELRMDDLILWTSKPDVYRKVGFETGDDSILGSVNARALPEEKNIGAIRAEWPGVDERRGLPPFAIDAHKITRASASIIVLHDGAGCILAEWQGADEEVCNLINCFMPGTWRINARRGDALLKMLEQERWVLDLQPVNLQMVMHLRARTMAGDPYQLRILDRI